MIQILTTKQGKIAQRHTNKRVTRKNDFGAKYDNEYDITEMPNG